MIDWRKDESLYWAKMFWRQGRRQKLFQGRGGQARERLRPRNSTNKLSSILSVAVSGRSRHTHRVHLKGKLRQEPRVKSEDLFYGETLISGKMCTFLENFRQFLCEKIVPRSPFGFNHPRLLMLTSAAKKYDGWWEFMFSQSDCLLKNTLAVIMCENPRVLLLAAPAADANIWEYWWI